LNYSVWPSQLAERISAVDHPDVGVWLDVGYAALAVVFFGFDLVEECAATAPPCAAYTSTTSCKRPTSRESRKPRST
jgi:hypothetical protein